MKFEDRKSFGWPATAAGYAPCDQGLVVHYDGSDQGLAGKSHQACRQYWKNTRKFHMNSRGWADIAYAFAVCPHGIVMEGRGWQRQQAAQPGGNSTWTSVTFMSGPSEAPTRAQINAFKQLRAWLRGKGLGAGIRGHRDFISTSCPGEKLYALVKNGGLAGPPEQRPEEEDDVPIRTSLGKTKPQELAWGKWTRITWDVEHADPEGAHADGNYPGYIAPETSWADFHATVRVEGLQPGDEYQLRYEVHDWSGGKSTGNPWTEIHADHPATRGVQFVTGSCSKKLKKGQHAYVAIAVFPGGDTTGRPAPKAVSGRWTVRQDKS
ncbi:peptidoglycan recognition family protein [uncultured Thermomonospora sp.]|uniref:peptidoglycan recognition protein family protein n=1 Tax=uncultured Thermomonospora sp. TaxID=671175 RepID=UPI00259BCD76|nr:peptidoglycan recognition family protein [uncultured Thermomonospora sp.]